MTNPKMCKNCGEMAEDIFCSTTCYLKFHEKEQKNPKIEGPARVKRADTFVGSWTVWISKLIIQGQFETKAKAKNLARTLNMFIAKTHVPRREVKEVKAKYYALHLRGFCNQRHEEMIKGDALVAELSILRRVAGEISESAASFIRQLEKPYGTAYDRLQKAIAAFDELGRKA